MPLVPDLLVGELEHDEAGSAQPLHARGIELLVDEAGVEALALDLDDQRKIGISEVDPTAPAVAVTDVALAPHRSFAGLKEDLLEASLQVARGRDRKSTRLNSSH